jgi:hypothetical protein
VLFKVREGGRNPPPYPSIFIKPSTALARYDDDISIPKLAQVTLDYEGELVGLTSLLTQNTKFIFDRRSSWAARGAI